LETHALNFARPITKIDKGQLAVVALGVDPAFKKDFLPDFINSIFY
jgi:hypothetical protein